MRRLALVVIAALAAPACFVEDLATTPSMEEASTSDAVQACAIPERDANAGNEAVFYECAEESADSGAGCGPSGYLIGYGAKYARRFYHDTRPRMSARGQVWIDDVLVCLQ